MTTWQLTMTNVQREDEGNYMCQLNTDPMKSLVSLSLNDDQAACRFLNF